MMSIMVTPYPPVHASPLDAEASDRLFDIRRRERGLARGRPWPQGPAKCAALQTPTAQPPEATFEEAILPHLAAATRLARSLTRDPVAADDVVQDACVRAWRHFASFKGDNGRPWLLRIVRNVAFTRLRARRTGIEVPLDDDADNGLCLDIPDPGLGPEAALLADEDAALLNDALRALPAHLRQCVELRVVDELSYKEIAEIVDIPLGTVMSRLYRARRLLMAPRPAMG